MDFATIIGTLGGMALIFLAIITGSDEGITTFVNLPSMLIVGGGTVAATAIAFPTRELKLIFSVSRRVFRNPKTEMQSIMKFLLECGVAARRSGNLVLEDMAKKTGWKPIQKGLGLIADGTDSNTITEILNTEQKNMEEHHRVGQKIFQEMGKFAPSFGMIGTLVGLVQMLSTLEDPKTIGPKMAVALLTTFYGALIANLIFLPMATKLERRSKIEAFAIRLMIVGLISINKGDNIAIMREKLGAYLAGEEQSDVDRKKQSKGGGRGDAVKKPQTTR